MMRTGTYNIFITWLTVTIVATVVVPSEYTVYVAAFGIITGALHAWLFETRADRIDFGSMYEDFHVIDHGQNPKMDLGDHLEGHYILVPACEVEDKIEEIREMLEISGNYHYKNDRFEVYGHYFRYGVRCNESQDDYEEYLTEELEGKRLEKHTEFERGVMGNLKLKEGWYLDNYIRPHLNGSSK